MNEKYYENGVITCPVCKKHFGSIRGVKVHKTTMHKLPKLTDYLDTLKGAGLL